MKGEEAKMENPQRPINRQFKDYYYHVYYYDYQTQFSPSHCCRKKCVE